jgi:hypothetical protein
MTATELSSAGTVPVRRKRRGALPYIVSKLIRPGSPVTDSPASPATVSTRPPHGLPAGAPSVVRRRGALEETMLINLKVNDLHERGRPRR